MIFFTYIRISKDSSAKYYQNNKEKLQKKFVKDIKVFLKKKKKKSDNVREWYNNLPEDENKSLLSIKKHYEMIKNALLKLKETIILKSNDLKSYFEKTILKL